jgi:hypothetical protein
MEVYELIDSKNLEDTLEKWSEGIKKESREANIEIAQKLKGIRQTMYDTDAKKTIQLLTKDQTPQCEVEHELLKNFFTDRWKKGEPIDRNLSESIYKLEESIGEENKEKSMKDLIDFTKMKELLRTRENLSARGLDGITNPLLKLGRDKGAKMLKELMKIITKTGFFAAEWKNARTILIYKEGERSNPENWRPITVASVNYRAIFCRIAQTLYEAHEVQGISMFDIEQKGFVPVRAGCVEYAAVANAIINDAVEKKKQPYILSLDLRDAFGSIPHDLIEEILTSIGTPKELIKLIMNSYEGATIQMQTKKGFTDTIII